MRTTTRYLTLVAGLALAVTATVVLAPTRPTHAADADAAPTVETGAVEWLDDDVAAITRTDVTGRARTVNVQVRPPAPTSGASPVVVWSHGGSGGRTNPTNVGTTWGRAFTESGFTFIAVAHPAREGADRDELCEAIGVPSCETFNPLHWDRPHDVSWVIDWLVADAAALGIDPGRIIHAGHSAGAVAVVTTAGATWPFESALAPSSDPRPVAFIASSPPGVEARGYEAADFAGIDRPLLFLTGAGDTTTGTEADDRRATFDLIPSTTDAFLLWIDDDRARHGVFDLDQDPCRRAGGTRAACRTLVRTVGEAAMAFASAVTACEGFDPDGLTRTVTEHLLPGMVWEATDG